MMPGETPPAPAGTAATGGACANCGVLQQSINEYVAALIALKQKMIDGDRLLTEYQQKCTALRFAEREISALRCQVDKMLQKILPLEKCQEELGSLKAELEEKKSSLKIYRDTQLEYIKIKEKILNSDFVRRKLETKVKKLEEAATKHTQDFRQLKTENKRLEKELKKAQGKLDGVIKEKSRKFKHAETQSSSEVLETDIDKGRVKFLLEELWMCIDSATGKRENEKNDPVLAFMWDKEWSDKRRLTATEGTLQIHEKIRKCDGKTQPWCSSVESAVKQNSVTAMIIQKSTEPFGDDCAENRTTEEHLHSDEDKTVDVMIQTGREHSTSGFSDQEQRDPGGNVMDILNWARPLPALLSPVQLSPLTTRDTLLGDSSDEEDDCSTSAVEGILQDQVQPPSHNATSPGDDCNGQCKSCEHGFDAEMSLNLSWNEENVHISPNMSSKEKRDVERKQAEGATLTTNMETNKEYLEENSEDMETENRELTGATAHESEDVEEQNGDGEDMDSEEEDSSGDFILQSFKPQNQMEKCSVVEPTEENVTLITAVDNEGTHEKFGKLVNTEREKLVTQRETPREASVLQSVTHLLSEQYIVPQREDAEEKSDVLIGNEEVENKSKNVIELTNMAGAVEISAHSQCSEIKYDSEEILEKQHMQTKDKVNRECEPETVKVSRHYLPVSAAEGIRTLLSVFPKGEQLKIEDITITRAPAVELAMKFNRGSVLEIAELSELLHSAENVKLVDINEGVYLQSKPYHKEDVSNLSQRKSNLENILALPKTACIIGAESSVAKCESSVLDFTEVKGETKQSENLHNTLECGQSKSQNFRVFESLEAEVKVNSEDCRGESSELLARGDTIESLSVESNPTSLEQFAKPLTQLLITENVKCDEIEGKLDKQSKELVTETYASSLKWEKNAVKKNNILEIICQPTSEMDYGSGLAFPTQKDLEKCGINNEETSSPVQGEICLESTRPPDLNFSLQKVVGFLKTNFRGKAAFSCSWENKGHTNSITSSTFSCSSENLEEAAEILSAEKVNMGEELGCPEREYVHENGMKTSDKEQPVDKEPQASAKSQITYANSYKKNALLQKFDCQESGCRTSTWKVRTDPSRTGSLTETAVGSSPLKFCTCIPKHALPVPGRFPLFAAVSADPGAPQDNSVKILDTMYPELSARARTLNILKGNIQLNRCAFPDSQSLPGPVSQAGGFKAIASTSTAFVKAGSNLKSDCSKDEDKGVQNQQLFSRSSNHLEKRTLLQVSMPRSAKRLRLDSEPLRMEPSDITAVRNTKNTISERQEAFLSKSYEISDSSQSSNLEESLPAKKDPDCQKVSLALKKVAESCFDLLPVIKGHVFVGNVSKIPVMRDEEREVVYEFGIKNKHLAESLLHVILNKLKAQKNAKNYNFSQALCRVYAGICRQLGDLERARLFCYSLLKEDFPDSEKLILFITNVWSDIFVFQGAINKAMQLVVRQSASNEMLACLSAYLNWEQSSSLDAGTMVSNLLLEMQSCTKVEFHLSEQYGEDLSEDAWQYIFAVDLLCSHMKWDWTHDNVISKVLWPSMDNWIKERKGHETAPSIRDSVIALTLRLIGRLGQIGLKEGYLAAVKNISSVIGLFVHHAKEEGVPWGVQLAAVYSLCDLGSSNPEGIVEAIHAWRAKVLNNIPSAITDAIAEITSLCEMHLN
ncbi:uncharacterized protein FYW23_004941 isoform 5-T5 [Sylvia borin]